MTALYLLAFSFCLAAVCNLVLISMGLAIAGARRSPTMSYGAMMALIAGGAVLIVAADNFGMVASGAAMEAVEIAVTLAAGPVFLLLIASLHEKSLSLAAALTPAIFAAAIWVADAVFTGAAADVRFAVLLQIGYTIAAAALVLSVKTPGRRDSARRLARLLLFIMIAIHAVQLARMGLPQAAVVKPAVPVVISIFAFFVIFAGAMRFGVRFIRQRPKRNAITLDEDRLRELMRAENAFLSPNYRLADLASSTGLPAQDLSRAINSQTDGGFVELLNSERLRHAGNLLRDPAEAASSIEAIALLSGFRSRSAFYRAFTKRFGVTPAAYKKTVFEDPLS